MEKIYVLVSLDGERIDDSTWELASAARESSGANPVTLTAVLIGHDLAAQSTELGRWFDEVVVFDAERLAVPDGGVTTAILAPFLEREAPSCVLAAQSNYTMDFMPALAVRLGRPILTDCLSVDLSGDRVSAIRPAYGGKVHVRVSTAPSENGYMATMRPGARQAGECPALSGSIRTEALPGDISPVRSFVKTVAGDVGEVDITQAERLVAVGRGLQDEDSLEMIHALAKALGAEVACSRPIVDNQWLPKDRQVGTSGKTVRPKIYVAIGISGAFQHLGGVKGDPFLVAINKNPGAPIFAEANVGLVADLYKIVPLLTDKLRALKQ